MTLKRVCSENGIYHTQKRIHPVFSSHCRLAIQLCIKSFIYPDLWHRVPFWNWSLNVVVLIKINPQGKVCWHHIYCTFIYHILIVVTVMTGSYWLLIEFNINCHGQFNISKSPHLHVFLLQEKSSKRTHKYSCWRTLHTEKRSVNQVK